MTDSPKAPGKKEKKKPQYGLSASIIAGALVVFMCVFIPSGPMKKYNEAKAEVTDLQSQLQLAVQNKKAEETRLRSQEELMGRLRERKADFDLWSFLNAVLTETSLKERAILENYKPRSDKRDALEFVTMVQMTIGAVSLEELVDVLHKIYASNNLILLYRLEYLRPANDNKGLDCKIIFLSPKALSENA